MMVFQVNNRFMLLCVALFLPVTVSSLKCYQSHCLSSPSLANCSKASKELTCPEVADSCVKISTDVTSDYFSFKSFSYGCATKKMCEDAAEQLKECKKFNQGGYQAKCSLVCCKGDLCNPHEKAEVSLSVTLVPGHLIVFPGVILTLASYFKLF